MYFSGFMIFYAYSCINCGILLFHFSFCNVLIHSKICIFYSSFFTFLIPSQFYYYHDYSNNGVANMPLAYNKIKYKKEKTETFYFPQKLFAFFNTNYFVIGWFSPQKKERIEKNVEMKMFAFVAFRHFARYVSILTLHVLCICYFLASYHILTNEIRIKLIKINLLLYMSCLWNIHIVILILCSTHFRNEQENEKKKFKFNLMFVMLYPYTHTYYFNACKDNTGVM